MNKLQKKILPIVVAVISVIGLILWVMIAKVDAEGEGPIGTMLNLGKGLVIIAGALAILFTLLNIVSDKQKLKKTLRSLIVFFVLAAVSYGLAKGVALEGADVNITEKGSRWVGTGLYLFYLLTGFAFVIMIFFGIKKIFVK